VEIERNRLTVHDAPAIPTGGAMPEMPQSGVLDSDALILLEERLENDRCRLDFAMVRALGKNWRVEPVWAGFSIETPA